jgi:formylglycine-generating enzyme required for sulfatase activity
MALRGKTLTKEPDQEEPAPELLSQRRKPEVGQFRLQVDRQTKGSYVTYEAAEKAGMEIKKAHPVVRVSVYDAVECTNRIIELPKA